MSPSDYFCSKEYEIIYGIIVSTVKKDEDLSECFQILCSHDASECLCAACKA